MFFTIFRSHKKTGQTTLIKSLKGFTRRFFVNELRRTFLVSPVNFPIMKPYTKVALEIPLITQDSRGFIGLLS